MGIEDDVVKHLLVDMIETPKYVRARTRKLHNTLLTCCSLISNRYRSNLLAFSMTKHRSSAKNYGIFCSTRKRATRVCLKSSSMQRRMRCRGRGLRYDGPYSFSCIRYPAADIGIERTSPDGGLASTARTFRNPRERSRRSTPTRRQREILSSTANERWSSS